MRVKRHLKDQPMIERYSLLAIFFPSPLTGEGEDEGETPLKGSAYD